MGKFRNFLTIHLSTNVLDYLATSIMNFMILAEGEGEECDRGYILLVCMFTDFT